MKRIVHIYVRFIQRILITIFLTILYFLVFSVTKLFMLLVPNKNKRRSAKSNSFWINAEGYVSDMNSALEQS
jgi:hypothetical protein